MSIGDYLCFSAIQYRGFKGWRCSLRAKSLRDGLPVCAQHARSKNFSLPRVRPIQPEELRAAKLEFDVGLKETLIVIHDLIAEAELDTPIGIALIRDVCVERSPDNFAEQFRPPV